MIAADLVAVGVDYVVVVRGAIFSVEQTRPDFHQPAGFNAGLVAAISAAVDVPVVLQGSVVDVGQAEWALGGYDDPARCAAVEMTRAQIADPDLVAKLRAGTPERIRPCTRCNQTCQVRDARNPLVTCIGEPTSGRETEDPDWYSPARTPPVPSPSSAAGRPGLEAARVAAERGHRVTLVERAGGRRRDGRGRRPERTARRVAGRRGRSARGRGADRHRRRPGRRVRDPVHGQRPRRPGVRGRRRRDRRSTSPTSGAARRRCRHPATSCCSTRSAARSRSPSPRSSAAGPCSSPRTTSPATSSPAPATSPRPTSASPRPACASSGAACCAPVGAGRRHAARQVHRRRPHRAVRGPRRLRVPPADRADPRRRAAAGDCVAPRTVHEAILEGRRPLALIALVGEVAERGAGRVEAAHAVDAAAGRGRRRAQVDAGDRRAPRLQAEHRAGDDLAPVRQAAGDVAADAVLVVGRRARPTS